MKQVISDLWNMSPSELNFNLLIIMLVLAAILWVFLHWLNKKK